MPFPVTIDASVGGAEQPGKFSTFFNSPNRYQVQFVLDAPDGQALLAVFKSADSGNTWAEVDSAGRVSVLFEGPGSTSPYTCCQVGTAIYIVYLNPTFICTMTSFDMASDTWSVLSVDTPYPPFSPYPQSGEGGFLLGQYACSYRASTGDILFVLAGDGITGLGAVPHSICCFNVFNIAGSAWNGSWTDLDYVDYADIATWDLIPCGMVTDPTSGRTTVFMQQVARTGPGPAGTTSFSSAGTFTWDVPLDAPATAVVERWGAGGGAQSGTGGQRAGGAGAYNRTNAAAITAGGTETIVVGAGGATGSDGGSTTALGDTAAGGAHGTALAGGLGGAASGGDVAFAGGNGGSDGGTVNGGGGGGSGLNNAAGGDGQDGQPGLNPPRANGGIGTGNGGNGGAVLITDDGDPGQSPGGGGGGDTNVGPGASGVGADGGVNISWIAVRNTHDSRMYQQSIEADNSLGVITEITQGAASPRDQGSAPVPISFDAGQFNGTIFIAFTGANGTGSTDVAVGQGATANPVALSFQDFDSGNGGDGVDACPSVCAGTVAIYCCYISGPTAGPVAFLYRADPGLGFGSPVSIGTLSLPDVREFGRLQSSVLGTLPEITFGTPTAAIIKFNAPG